MDKTSKEQCVDDYQNIFEAASESFVVYDLETGMVVDANPAACKMYGYSYAEFVGVNPVAFMNTESYHTFQEHLRIVQTGGIVESCVVHTHRDGSTFHAEVRKSLVQYKGRPCMLSATRDVTQRVQLEKSQNALIETRRREQAALLTISRTLASNLEIQPALILEQLREIVDYTQSAFFVLEDMKLISLAVGGVPKLQGADRLRISLTTRDDLAVLFSEHRPLQIANLRDDNPQAQALRSLLGSAVALLDGMHSWMWVPLVVRGHIIGCIGLAKNTPDYFTDHHADLVLSVANQAAITMMNTELYGQAQALAALEERQNLAHSLHDAVNQSLFSAGIIAEVLPRLWERDQAEARRSLEDLRNLTRGAQAEMRALLAELRPSTLTDSKLGDLLQLLANALSGRANIPVTVTVNGEFNFPPPVQIAFYRICQEALTNIAKHAKASMVEIFLEQNGAVIEMRIRDDGQGFNTGEVFSGHYGLSMMRERAQAAGASLSIASQPGHGTELIMTWVQS